MTTRLEHWEQVYRTRAPEQVSWYQPAARTSLALIRRVAPAIGAAILDVGGGASRLVDGLLDAGYRDITVLDLAADALAAARSRIGDRASQVRWIAADIVSAGLPGAAYDIWHDRAVFHFLTDAADRVRYVAQVKQALKPGGHLLMATFALDGPPRCSGLDVVRYSAQSLRDELGPGFDLVDTVREEHQTPSGAIQRFQYSLFRM
ncbi:MAG TPA: class I SAM-dependent methyltransferase [Gemmatimonadales bacterium]|nr:class I SAM-dependent methyltransferase [Gemmatimonadales bacterium]